jgi:hypothetical protein
MAWHGMERKAITLQQKERKGMEWNGKALHDMENHGKERKGNA